MHEYTPRKFKWDGRLYTDHPSLGILRLESWGWSPAPAPTPGAPS